MKVSSCLPACFPLPSLFLFTILFLAIPVSAFSAIAVQVELTGIEDPLKANVLNFLAIEKQKDSEDFNVRWLKRLHGEAPDEIREALQPYGYYLPVIKSRLKETDTGWIARYTVDKGPAVRIGKCDIRWQGEGAEKEIFKKSIEDYYKNAPDTLVHSEYESAKSRFLNTALSAGYPQAKIIKSEVLVDLEKNSADIFLHMDTGALYHFGEIHFRQDFLSRSLLNSYVTITPGEEYSYDALLEFQQNLIASSYAQEVTVKPLFNKAEDMRVPLEVIMTPIPPHRFAFGLGYETDVGFRGSARWTDRLINRYGHHSDVLLNYSEREKEYKGQYSVPIFNHLTDSWVSSVSYEYEKKPTTISDLYELETALVRRNMEDTRFYKAFILRSIERFTVDLEPEESTELLIFGAIARFSEMEKSMYPQFGYFASADVRGAAESLISDTSFTRLHLKGKYMLGLGENGRLDTRMEIGTAWVDDFTSYPPSLRFFAGGDSSVRGYRYESLGPVNDDNIVVGGKNVFTASAEYDHRVAESWVLAGFVDGGNAYNDTVDKVYVGAGFGVRWLAPFGSLRVDLAWPVSEQPGIGDVRFHIGFGATL